MIAEGKIVAKVIRQDLKKNYPLTKFSVKSDYSAVRISYTDGPNRNEVEKLLARYEYGSFDGMEDIYNFDNMIDGLFQCKYVFVDRQISDELNKTVLNKIKSKWGNIMDLSENDFFKEFQCWKNNFVYRFINDNNI